MPLKLITLIYQCKSGENPSTCSSDILLKRPWPWHWGQGHQNLINSSACQNTFGENRPTGSKDILLTTLWHWKWGQGHQKLTISKFCHNNIQVGWMSINWLKKYHIFSGNLTFVSKFLTLNIRSRSPQDRKHLELSLRLIFGRNKDNGSLDISYLVKISYTCILSTPVTLKMRSRSPKSNQRLSLSHWFIHRYLGSVIFAFQEQVLWWRVIVRVSWYAKITDPKYLWIYPRKFVGIPSTGSRDIVDTESVTPTPTPTRSSSKPICPPLPLVGVGGFN